MASRQGEMQMEDRIHMQMMSGFLDSDEEDEEEAEAEAAAAELERAKALGQVKRVSAPTREPPVSKGTPLRAICEDGEEEAASTEC